MSTPELRAMDRESRVAIEELREAARPHGLIPESSEPTPGTDPLLGWLTVHFGGDIDRHRLTLHFAGATVERGADRHYEAKIEGHVANVTQTIRKLAAEFRKMKAR